MAPTDSDTDTGRFNFHRQDLAHTLCDSLEGKGLADARSGLFLAAPRRTGKSTFLREDLVPEVERRKWIALALLAAAQFVVVLDASIVNVALPSIGRDLEFSQDNLSWVVNAYTLFFGGFLLLGGRLADRLGRRRMFQAGMVLFALASLATGLALRGGADG